MLRFAFIYPSLNCRRDDALSLEPVHTEFDTRDKATIIRRFLSPPVFSVYFDGTNSTNRILDKLHKK